VVWYRGGLITSRCHKTPLRDGRDILVCIDEFDYHGVKPITLYTEDLRNPFANGDRLTPDLSDTLKLSAPFFCLVDNRRCCSPTWESDVGDPLTWGEIERVEFGTSTAGGPPPISVTATFGQGVWTAEAREAFRGGRDIPIPRQRDHDAFEKLLPPLNLLPPLKRYHIDFIWDGHYYKPAPSSIATAKIFADQ
jgi:hypothetical protein